MGTKLAPALATIYIGDLKEAFLDASTKQPILWVRYIDDVFTIWTHTLQDFKDFLAGLNNIHPKIHFTVNISTQTCEFLDLMIYKPPDFLRTGKLSTTIHYKSTNTFSFTMGSSYLPRHILKGIAVGELTRVIRNTTSPAICEHYEKKMIKRFRRRGYTKTTLDALRRMTHNTRGRLLRKVKRKKIERPLPFHTKYNTYRPSPNRVIRNRWNALYNDKHLFPIFPNNPFTVYKNTKRSKLYCLIKGDNSSIIQN